ncbi:hypothetical protein [Paenibacillus rhizophilus]|uniref:Uncharacterized protein n=1 Tax=Paenibacillus rhizophilus TaxID=1850366 RepID=A0A3N9PXX2_9BACL|nr:hypothetical protein [Paenibacillus rhizophilus]RQW10046.1 hypothetical protein EH198_16560 [Paenibacillus rhizophilus]
MASVNLPNTDGLKTIDELKNAVGKMVKELSWLLEHLDTRNINELNAEKIVAGSITAQQMAADSVTATQIQADSINSEKIQADAVTAEKINVSELSAITANLGHIISGLIESVQIFGSYIATRNGAYPRAELNDDGDLIAVYTDADNSVTIEPGITTEPTIVFRKDGNVSLSLGPLSGFGFSAMISALDLSIGTLNGSLQLVCGTGVLDYINIPGFGQLYSSAESQTLADALASKADKGVSTSISGSANGGIPIGTQLLDADGVTTWTWMGIPGHSHAQN